MPAFVSFCSSPLATLAKRSRTTILAGSIAVTLGVTAGIPQAHAEDGSWSQVATSTQDNPHLWSAASNWTGNKIADGVDRTAVFNVNLPGDQIISLEATGRTIGHLFFRDTDTATAGGYGIGKTGDGALTLDVTSGPSAVYVSNLATGSAKKLAVTVPIINGDGILKIGDGEFSIRAASPGMTGGLIAAGGNLNTRSLLSNIPSIQATNGGTFQVDFANAGSVVTDLVPSTIPVTLGGTVTSPNSATVPPALPWSFNTFVGGNGTFTITGKGNTANVQSVNGLTLNQGTHTVNVSNAGAGSSATLNLGAITRKAGSSVNFNLNGAGTSTVTTSTGNGGGSVLGGWAIVGGNTWAISAGDGVNAGAVTGLANYSANTWSAGTHTDVVAGIASASGATDSLRFNTAAATTVTLTGASSITSGGILVTSTVAANASQITGGSLTSGTNELIVIQNNTNAAGGFTIASKIEDNGNPVAFTKAGLGTLVLTGANTYTGTTYVSGGTLQIGAGGSLASDTIVNTATLTIDRSDTLTLDSDISGTGVLVKNGTGVLTLSGNSTYTGQTNHRAGTIALASDTALGNGVFRFDVGGATLRSSDGNARTIGNFLDIANSATFGSSTTGDLTFTGTLAMGGAAKTMTINNGITTFTGVMTGGPTNNFITKNGDGTMVLANPASNAKRPMSIDKGILQISSEGNLGANPDALFAEHLRFNGGTLQATATFTIDDSNRGITVAAGGGTISVDSGATLTITKGISDPNSPAVAGPLKKTGEGTLVLSAANTYTGAATVEAGTLQVSGSLNGSSAVAVNGGTLLLGADNVLKDTAPFALGGGTLSTAGFDDTVGALTLSVSSTIDFGGSGSAFRFADSSSATWTGTLSIVNWGGSLTGGGADQLFFGSSAAGLSIPQIAAIQFVNPEGFAPGNYGAQMLPSGEIVVVPEPATMASLVGGVGILLGFGRRRRRF